MEGVFGNELWLSAVSNDVVVRALDEGGIPLEWILGGVAAVFFLFSVWAVSVLSYIFFLNNIFLGVVPPRFAMWDKDLSLDHDKAQSGTRLGPKWLLKRAHCHSFLEFYGLL
jgi:hypothetical protein